MNKTGPIIIIEDDIDDQKIMVDIFSDLRVRNELIFFEDGYAALEYLDKNFEVDPFLIFSDVNMPRIGGFELRAEIQKNTRLHKLSVPFLFFTTATHTRAVNDSPDVPVQGFFTKPGSYADLETMIRRILEYWQLCIPLGT